MMKRMALTTLAALLLGGTPLVAQQEIKLYPNGPKESNELNRPENKANRDDGWVSDISDARMYAYFAPQDKSNGAAVVICPGGGYAGLAATKEGSEYAQWFNERGVSAFVLYYRMPNGHSDVPLSDAHQAIRLMRQHASEWGIRQIGIMGSSAGGHLASTAATHFDEETRPDFQILFYPVITMYESTHAGSRENLLGKQPDPALMEEYSNERQVTPQTPPAFIMHSSDDRAVPIANSLKYTEALVGNGVPVSLHVYPIGGHGWGYRDNFIYKRQWTGELGKWLRTLNR